MIKSIIRTLRFLKSHPFAKRHFLKSLFKYFRWQIASRVWPYPSFVPFVNEAHLMIRPGMVGATGNLYAGLHEFNDMGFLLHLIRPTDVFFDIGANVGTYTVLAGKAIGVRTVALEPVPITYRYLEDNIRVNRIETEVMALNMGASRRKGQLHFSTDQDSVNHVVLEKSEKSSIVLVPVDALDNLIIDVPVLIKVDVEGFEYEVLSGAQRILEASKLKAIIIEINGSGNRYGVSNQAIHQLLLDYGFLPYDYDPFTRKLFELEKYNSHNTIYIRDLPFVTERIVTAEKFKVWNELV